MRKIILLFALLLLPHSAFAYTEIVDQFIDKGVTSLMHGGLKRLPEETESLDFNAPLSLDSQGRFRIDSGYEYQRTARIFGGRWSGSHAYEERMETAVAAPFSLFASNLRGSVAAGHGYRRFDVNVENRIEDIYLKSAENFEADRGGLFLDFRERLKVGASLVATDYRSRLEIPIEAEVAPCDYLRIGYRRSYIDLAANYGVSLSGSSGLVALRHGEELHELSLAAVYKGILSARYAQELGNGSNRRFEGRLSLPWTFYLVGEYQRRDLSFYQGFTVEGRDGGYLQGVFSRHDFRGGIGASPAEKWNLELNFRHRELDSSGGGIANSAAVIDFWPSLVVGNYNHIYKLGLSSDQYHAALDYKGESLDFGCGAQYLYLKTAARIDYWRSLLFGLGRSGADSLVLTTDRVRLLFLSVGLGYRWKNFAINYAIGQFVPLGSRDSKGPGETPPPAAGEGGGGGGDIWQSIADKINHNPGGNIQRLLLSVTF